MSNILVVVDYQYDFVSPNGALYVNGAEKLQDKIAKIIPDFDHVILTQDWHPFNHCSFKKNGGIWPVHCVSGTIGAGSPIEFMNLAKSFTTSVKGYLPDKEEYGAFETDEDLAVELDYNCEFGCLYDDDFVSTTFNSVDSIVVCGVAGDYCVLETLKNIVKHIGTDKVFVYLDGIVSIDGGEALNKYIAENSIKIY